jgi:hypothetical protein
VDRDEIEALGPIPMVLDLAAADLPARHDPHKLARALLAIARAR